METNSTKGKAILCIALFIAGFLVGTFVKVPLLDTKVSEVKTTVTDSVKTITPDILTIPDTQSDTQEDVQQETKQQPSANTVVTPTLTDSQKKMLESFGIDTEAVTVTASMVACAEAKLGSARVEEIKNGATPSFLEGASLFSCYNQ